MPGSYFKRQDGTMLFKSVLTIRILLATGLLISLFLPRIITITIVTALFLETLVPVFCRLLGILSEPDMANLKKGRYAAVIKDDFVVFLIGARPNNTLKITKDFKEMGDAMNAMIKELEDNPELGCLHSHSYIGNSSLYN